MLLSPLVLKHNSRNTIGIHNTAVGITNSDNNTAIGNTIGSYNTAIGITSGTHNTAVGLIYTKLVIAIV